MLKKKEKDNGEHIETMRREVAEATEKQMHEKDEIFRQEYEALCKRYGRRVVGVARKVEIAEHLWADEIGERIQRIK